MFIKDLPQLTLADLSTQIAPPSRTFTVPTSAIRVQINNQPDDVIRVGDQELPGNGVGLMALGNWLDIPGKFLDRIPADLLNTVLNTLLERKDEDVAVTVADQGLLDAAAPNGRRIPIGEVIDIASTVISPEAQVVDWRRDKNGYSFEAVTAIEPAELVDLEVNDISHGGLRFGQDLKNNLAPWVQPYIYRLVCTNGMEVPDPGLRVVTRGRTIDDVLDGLAINARDAFDGVDERIANFYALKAEKVNYPADILLKIGKERGIPDRVMASIIATLPQYGDEGGDISAFDIVNAITNRANDPNIQHKFGSVRRLQTVGGFVAFDHEARCPTCRHRLGD